MMYKYIEIMKLIYNLNLITYGFLIHVNIIKYILILIYSDNDYIVLLDF
jgi:hypothetical protein